MIPNIIHTNFNNVINQLNLGGKVWKKRKQN